MPINVPDKTVDDSLSEAEVPQPANGMLTKARIEAIRAAAEAADAARPVSAEDVSAAELIDGAPGRHKKRWILGLRLSEDEERNDALLVAAERDAPPQPRVRADELGQRLVWQRG